MTVYEQNLLEELGQWYADQVKDAIKNKPIERSTKAQGSFSAVANATGRLAESLRFEVSEEALEVFALDYIDKLVFGQAPSRLDNVSVFEIEEWIRAKGLELSSVSVMYNLQKNGSSIWQKWQGENSGLLNDISLEEQITQVKEKLVLKTTADIKSDFFSQFNIAA